VFKTGYSKPVAPYLPRPGEVRGFFIFIHQIKERQNNMVRNIENIIIHTPEELMNLMYAGGW